MQIDITQRQAAILTEPAYSTILLHWGTRFTRELEYKKQVELLDILENPDNHIEKRIAKCKAKYNRMMQRERIQRFAVRVKNKIVRTLGIRK